MNIPGYFPRHLTDFRMRALRVRNMEEQRPYESQPRHEPKPYDRGEQNIGQRIFSQPPLCKWRWRPHQSRVREPKQGDAVGSQP